MGYSLRQLVLEGANQSKIIVILSLYLSKVYLNKTNQNRSKGGKNMRPPSGDCINTNLDKNNNFTAFHNNVSFDLMNLPYTLITVRTTTGLQ